MDVELQDATGARVTQGDALVTYEAQGAEILGTSNAHLTDETLYPSATRRLHKGRTTLVLRKYGDMDEITLTATAEGLPAVKLTLNR